MRDHQIGMPDVYGRGPIATHLIYGGQPVANTLGFLIVVFPIVYFLWFQRVKRTYSWSAIFCLFLISGFLSGPLFHFLYYYADQPLLAIGAMLIFPFLVLSIALAFASDAYDASVDANSTLHVTQREVMSNRSEPTEKFGMPATAVREMNRLETKSNTVKSYMAVATESVQTDPDFENAIYAQIANEIETGNTDKGLWPRLYAECDGDEKGTRVQYIKSRAANLIAVRHAAQVAQDKATKEETEKRLQDERPEESHERVVRLATDVALKEALFKQKEREAPAPHPITKETSICRVHGFMNSEPDDAVALALRAASDLATERKEKWTVFLITLAFFVLIFAVAIISNRSVNSSTQGLGSGADTKQKIEKNPASPNATYEVKTQTNCLTGSNPSVAELCSIYLSAVAECKKDVVVALANKGYPSLLRACKNMEPASVSLDK